MAVALGSFSLVILDDGGDADGGDDDSGDDDSGDDDDGAGGGMHSKFHIKPFLLSYSCCSPWPPPAGCGYPPSRQFLPGLKQITFHFRKLDKNIIQSHIHWISLSTTTEAIPPRYRLSSTIQHWIKTLSNINGNHYPI